MTLPEYGGGELQLWMECCPPSGESIFSAPSATLHTHNRSAPCSTVASDIGRGFERAVIWQLGGLGRRVLLMCARQPVLGHFTNDSTTRCADVAGERRPAVGDRPLSWWAVKRVAEIRDGSTLAGRAASACCTRFTCGRGAQGRLDGTGDVPGCDDAGGVDPVGALVGWRECRRRFSRAGDSSVQQRCRRLELLLLTGLGPRD